MSVNLSSLVIPALFVSLGAVAQSVRPAISAMPDVRKPHVEIIYLQENKPDDAEKIGHIELAPAGMNCSIKSVLQDAQYQAALKGGNAIYVTGISALNQLGCYQIQAEIYNLKEPYISSPNLGYPFENVSSTKTGTSTLVEIPPQFPGGNASMVSFIKNTFRYPPSLLLEDISGKVIVAYVIDPTGKPTELTVIQSVRPELDAEVLRVVSEMPDWSPGYQNGKAVPVRMTYPVNFAVEENKAFRKKKNKK
ncbi:energy transducer TonB [Pontibacter sp. Tf4]|uniref:energy transducer TonB n=1 Tax=Pontibacter sp. Tf4 TaxID=2761620 RepID=UPI0016246BB4|nr:energy transducer TonB [Pontibacter sp. Tf4]MBB6610398.1 energy transducer TonB [Pontibacter sp. Tf4]